MAEIYDNEYRKKIAEQEERTYLVHNVADRLIGGTREKVKRYRRSKKNIKNVENIETQARGIVAPFFDEQMHSVSASANTTFYLYPNQLRNYRERSENDFRATNAAEVYGKDGRLPFDLELTSSPMKNGNAYIPLYYQRTNYASYQNKAQIYEGLRNIEDKQGVSYLWDLETLGGIKSNGRKIAGPITEYSFAKTIGDISSGVMDEADTEIHNSIIGSTHEEYLDNLKLLEKYKAKKRMTENELVSIHRFALMGNSTIDRSRAAEGLFSYSHFATKEEIGGIYAASDIQKGIEQLYGIGKDQRINGLVNINGHKLLGWQADIYKSLEDIIRNDYTAVSHNGSGFDIHELQQFIMSDKMSQDAKKAFLEITGGHAITFNHQFDGLMALRENVLERFGLFGTDAIKKMRELGFTSGQQEALLTKIDVGHYDKNLAHNAREDSIGLGTILYKSGLFSPKDKNYILGRDYTGKRRPTVEKRVKMNGKQLFYAANNSSAADFNLMTVTKDNMGDVWRTSDGVSIGKNGATKELFGQTGIQRGTAVTPFSIGELKEDSSLYKKFAKVNKDLNIGSLHYVAFMPHSGSKNTRAKSPVYYVGALSDIQNWMQQNLVHFGDIAKDGSITTKYVSASDKEIMATYTRDSNGQIIKNELDPNQVIKESDLRFDNEAAARASRNREYKKDKALIKYIDTMDEYAEKEAGPGATAEEIETKRNEFRSRAFILSQQYQTKQRNGEKVTLEDAKGTLQEFFGWKDTDVETGDEKYLAYPETLNAAVAREQEVRKNYFTVKSTMDAALKDANGFEKEAAIYYKARMANIYDASIEASMDNFGRTKHASAQNMRRTYVRGTALNRFDINIAGFHGLPRNKQKVISINMGTSGFGVIDKIYSAIGLDKTKDDDITKVNKLKLFQKFLNKKGYRLRQDGSNNIDPNIETPDIAGQKIISMLRDKREEYPFYGLPKEMLQNVVSSPTSSNYGFTPKKIKELNDDFKKSNYITLETKEASKQTKEIARNIVDNVMFDKVDKEMLLKNGYTEHDADILMDEYIRKKDDANLLVNSIIERVRGNKSGIIVEGDRVWIQGAGGKREEIFLPKEKFSNSAFHAEVGERRTRVASTIGFSYNEKTGKMEIRSTYGTAYNKWLGLFNYKARKDNEEKKDITDTVSYFLSKINGEFRKQSSVFEEDIEDARNEGTFDINDFTKDPIALDKAIESRRHLMSDSDKEIWDKYIQSITNIDKDGHMLLRDDFQPQGFSEMEYQYQALMVRNPNVFGAAMMDLPNDPKFKSLYGEAFDLAAKHIGDGRAIALTGTKIAFEDYTTRGGFINDSMSRALRFNKNEVTPALEKRGVKVGSILATGFESSRLNTRDGLYDTHLRLNRLSIASADFRKMVNRAIEDKVIKSGSLSAKFLTSVSTNDGSGLISSYVNDNVLQHSAMNQTIVIKDLVRDEETPAELANRRSTPLKMRKMSDGHITFEYSNGLFVQHGDVIGRKKGYLQDDKIIANQDGFLSQRFYKGKTQITTEQLYDIVNNDAELMKEAHGDGWGNKVLTTLREKYGLDLNYAIKGVNIKTNPKLVDYSEKNVTKTTSALFGSVDNRLRAFAKVMGATQLLDHTQTQEVIDSIAEDKPFEQTLFGKMVTSYAIKNKQAPVSSDIIEKVIDKHFGSRKGMVEAINKERNSIQDDLDKILHRYLGIDKDTSIDMIVNNEPGKQKHKRMSFINEVMTNLKDLKNMSNEEVMKEMSGVAKMHYDEKAGQIILDEDNDRVDYTKLKEVIQKHFVKDGKYITEVEGKYGLDIHGDVGRSVIQMLPHVDRERIRANGYGDGKAIKANERYIETLQMHTWTDEHKEAVRRTLVGAAGELGEKLYIENISGVKKNDVVNQALINQFERDRYETPGKKHLWYDEDELSFLDDGGDPWDEKTPYGKAVKETSEEYQKLLAKGMSNKDIERVINIARRNGAKGLTSDYASLLHMGTTFGIADDFNSGSSAKTVEQMVKNGFQMESLDKLHTALDTVNAGSHAALGNKVIIDMHSDALDRLGVKLYSDERDRYLAIPWIDPGMKDERDGKYVGSKINSALSLLKGRYDRFIEDFGTLSEEEKERRRATLIESANEVKQSITDLQRNKKQILAQLTSYHFAESVIATATGHRLYGDEQDSFFSKIDAFGINLKEQAAKKARGETSLEIGYAVLGNNVMHSWYDDKYFYKLAAGDEKIAATLKKQTFKDLSLHGTITHNVRYPINYNGSISGTMTYMNNVVSGDQALVSEAQWLAATGDFDSDAANVPLIKTDATIRIGEKTVRAKVDYGTYNSFKSLAEHNKSMSIELDDGGEVFREAKAGILRAAAIVNSKESYKKNDKPLKKSSLDPEFLEGDVVNDGSTMYIPKNRTFTQEEHNHYSQAWDRLEASTRERVGEKYDELSKADRYGEITKTITSVSDGSEEEMKKALNYHAIVSRQSVENLQALGKAAAGPIDAELNNLATMSRLSSAYFGSDENAFAIARQALGESALTSKSEHGQPDITRIKQIQKAHRKMWRAAQTGRGIDEAEQEMRAVYDPLLKERDSEVKELIIPGLEADTEENLVKKRNYVLDTVTSFARNVNLHGFDMKAIKAGMSNSNKTKDPLMHFEGTNSPMQKTIGILDDAAKDMGFEDGISRKISGPTLTEERRFQKNADLEKDEQLAARLREDATVHEVSSDIEKDVAQKERGGFVGAIGNGIKRMHMNSMSAGLVSIAGAALLSGYVSQPGGNASSDPGPAESLAQDGAAGQEAQAQMQPVPSFSDAGMNRQRGGPKQGYVINISANSPGGQAAAQSALSGAISSMPNSSSVNVNMNSSFSDQISQLQLGRMVQNSLGMT